MEVFNGLNLLFLCPVSECKLTVHLLLKTTYSYRVHYKLYMNVIFTTHTPLTHTDFKFTLTVRRTVGGSDYSVLV